MHHDELKRQIQEIDKRIRALDKLIDDHVPGLLVVPFGFLKTNRDVLATRRREVEAVVKSEAERAL